MSKKNKIINNTIYPDFIIEKFAHVIYQDILKNKLTNIEMENIQNSKKEKTA